MTFDSSFDFAVTIIYESITLMSTFIDRVCLACNQTAPLPCNGDYNVLQLLRGALKRGGVAGYRGSRVAGDGTNMLRKVALYVVGLICAIQVYCLFLGSE